MTTSNDLKYSSPKLLRFWRNGQQISLEGIAPSRTLLQILREDLNSKGTKEGCGQGDCGACTVVVAEHVEGELLFSAVNSCLRLAHSVNGLAVWSVEDIKGKDGSLHPAQSAMMNLHASQCGFCTPGFVMSLFAMYQNYTAKNIPITTRQAQASLSGNLCRCTGYRPIIDAATGMEKFESSKLLSLDPPSIIKALKNIRSLINKDFKEISKSNSKKVLEYSLPQTLRELLSLRSTFPTAQLIAGSTDAGLWITKQFKEFNHIIDLTQVGELRHIEEYPNHIAIGAGVKLINAFEALLKDRPTLTNFLERFAGLPIRNSATLAGNIATGSPVGDSMPLLISLGASLVLSSMQSNKLKTREVLLEDFYTGYRQTVLSPNEIISWIKVPKPHSNEILRAYKISKRFDDDISSVSLCVNLSISNDQISFASIGVGGVAQTPVKAFETEHFLKGKPFNQDSLAKAGETLQKEFTPLSDMRASAGYRKQVLENLLHRFAIETLHIAQPKSDEQAGEEIFWADLSNNEANNIRFLKIGGESLSRQSKS